MEGLALVDFDIIDKLKTASKNISPEKIFGYAWVLCWITAIWMYPIQFFLTGLFCLILAIWIFKPSEEDKKGRLPAVLSMDKSKRTLTVQKLYEDNLKWEDNEVCSGDAQLPVGVMKEGDVIRFCQGNVALRHIPTNKLLGAYEFK